MKQNIRLGRIAGIPIGMHWTVVVIVALITDLLAVGVLPSVIRHQPAGVYWTVAAAGAVLFVAALAAHEIAHAIVARRWGVQIRSITLWALGGITALDGNPSGKPGSPAPNPGSSGAGQPGCFIPAV